MPKGKHLPKETRACVRCGIIFSHIGSEAATRKYCSITCFRSQRQRQPKQCSLCNQLFISKHKKAKYCSVLCAAKVTGAQKSQKHIESGLWNNSRISKRLRIEELGKPHCERCSWDAVPGILEIHHKDRNRRNNQLINLELLCPNCHSTEHYIARDGQFANNLGRSQETLANAA